MLIHFLCLCPLRLAIMLNFNISKVANSERSSVHNTGISEIHTRTRISFGMKSEMTCKGTKCRFGIK